MVKEEYNHITSLKNKIRFVLFILFLFIVIVPAKKVYAKTGNGIIYVKDTVANTTKQIECQVTWSEEDNEVKQGTVLLTDYTSNPYHTGSPTIKYLSAKREANANGKYKQIEITFSYTNVPTGMTARFDPNYNTVISATPTRTFSAGQTGSYIYIYINHEVFAGGTTNLGTFSITPPTYTITYNGNGATSGSVSSTTGSGSVSLKSNSYLKTGYTFGGWNTNSSGTGTTYASGATYSLTSNVTLYAKWTPQTYTVTLDRQSGSGGSASVTATYNSSMPSISIPTRTGYTFGGYYTLTGGSGTQYYTSSGSSARAWDKISSTTLYAYWTPKTYSVGTYGGSNITVTYGQSWPPSVPIPYREGYTFGGYYSGSNGSGTQYYNSSGLLVYSGTFTGSSAPSMYPKWTANTYTLYYNANGGTVSQSSKPVTYDSSYGTLPTPEWIGHDFNGWYTSSSGGSQVTSSTTYKTAGDSTIYAHWTIKTFKVTYNGNSNTSGSVPSQQTLTWDGAVTIVGNTGNLKRSGYDFDGWNTNSSGTGDSYVNGDRYETNANLTLYAKWKVRDDTPYAVKHYKMRVGGSGYDLEETESFIGTTEAYVSPDVKTYTGFTSPSVKRQQITGDGKMVVEYYYTRNKYKVYYEIGPGYAGYPEYEEVWYEQEFSTLTFHVL